MTEPWNQQGHRPYGGGGDQGQPFQPYPTQPAGGYGQSYGANYPVQSGYPESGYQSQGYPGQAYSGQGYPGQGYPGQAYSGQGYPGQGYPGQVVPVAPVVAMVPQKSAAVAGLLSFFFGPLGMLYSTWVGALTMFLINLVLIWFTAGLILFLTIPAGVVWAVMAANEHNRRLLMPIAPMPPTTYR